MKEPSKRDNRIDPVERLIARGVCITTPTAVEIGPEVDLDRISDQGVVIHGGCRIFGEDTYIGAGVRLGAEAPVTVDNCQLAPTVALQGGYFRRAVFLAGARAGLGAHVREATILEEQASIAHTVGLKHTILFPFVTLGSLINFCDCLMAGGTGRQDHSEVGSSYIHFNFTPNQDKATASLIGDVPRGVMLNQRPIFLGGQGGIIGPCRFNYGLTAAAGTVLRKDELREDRLVFGGTMKAGTVPFVPGKYTGTRRIVRNNLFYMANLAALECWYRLVRGQFTGPEFPPELFEGLCTNIRLAIDERLRRFQAFCAKSAAAQELPGIEDWWPAFEALFASARAQAADQRNEDEFLEIIQTGIVEHGKNYLKVVQSLEPEESARGTRWLQSVVDDCCQAAERRLPDRI